MAASSRRSSSPASLVHADELLQGEDLGTRAVKLDYLKEQFNGWWGEQSAYQISPEADTSSPFLDLVLTKLVRPQQGFIEFCIGGDQVPLVLAERSRLENDARLDSLGARVISETDEWNWIQLHDIKRPVVALPHAYDPACTF